MTSTSGLTHGVAEVVVVVAGGRNVKQLADQLISVDQEHGTTTCTDENARTAQNTSAQGYSVRGGVFKAQGGVVRGGRRRRWSLATGYSAYDVEQQFSLGGGVRIGVARYVARLDVNRVARRVARNVARGDARRVAGHMVGRVPINGTTSFSVHGHDTRRGG